MDELKIPKNEDFFSCSTTKSHNEKISEFDRQSEIELANFKLELLRGQLELLKDELYSNSIKNKPLMIKNRQANFLQKISHINRYLQLKHMYLSEKSQSKIQEKNKLQSSQLKYNKTIDDLSTYKQKRNRFSLKKLIGKKKQIINFQYFKQFSIALNKNFKAI